jgi:hypothetical protein
MFTSFNPLCHSCSPSIHHSTTIYYSLHLNSTSIRPPSRPHLIHHYTPKSNPAPPKNAFSTHNTATPIPLYPLPPFILPSHHYSNFTTINPSSPSPSHSSLLFATIISTINPSSPPPLKLYIVHSILSHTVILIFLNFL